MSLTDVTQVAYSSSLPTDKIVRVFTGTYTPGQCITVNYTLSGSPNPIQVFRFPHGLTRPVLCDMQWSLDDPLDIGIFYEGGMNDFAFRSSIVYSDSTYIYVTRPVPDPTNSQAHYRVWCSWIDNYDGTSPLVEVFNYNDTKRQFDSRENYQKVQSQGVLSFSPGTFGSTQTLSVTHDLGYTPNVKVSFEAFAGQIWPLNAGGASNPFLYDDNQDECQLSVTNTAINVTMVRFSNQTKRAWYRIYYDAA